MTSLITGVSFENRGAELLLHASAQRAAGWGDDLAPAVTWRCGSHRQRRESGLATHVSVLQAGPAHHLGLALLPRSQRRRAGLSVDSDLRLVLDAHGFVLSDQWGSAFAHRLLVRVRRWRAAGVPVVLLPQAFGPFEDPAVAAAAREIVSSAALVHARDDVSLAHLGRLSLDESVLARVRLSPDITIAMPLGGPPPPRPGDVALVPNWNIASRGGSGARAAYLTTLVETALALRRLGRVPFGLCHEGEKDREILLEVQDRVGDLEVVSGLSGPACKRLLATCDAVVAGRFHACVSALSAGVPTVLHGWSHKYAALAGDFGWSEFVADPYEAPSTIAALEAALDADRAGLRERAGTQRLAVDAMWQSVEALARRGA
jgi:polysaccharide pyruvyl transferase WcaK-like protein